MDGVHIYRSEILIHSEADTRNQHQPQGNHGFLVRADFHSTHLFHLIRFCLFFFFLPFHKNIVLSVLVGFYTSGADEVLLPVRGIEVCISNRVTGMVHTVIPGVYPDVGYIRSGTVGTVKKYQVSGFCL